MGALLPEPFGSMTTERPSCFGSQPQIEICGGGHFGWRKGNVRGMQTVLIVDDYAPGVEWAMAALKALDCDLISAEGGRSALVTIRLRMPDLTLLDLHMADMDGFSVVRELRSDTATARLCL